ncbi:hypothetical protein DOTSEDRAFT_31857 [Dothistroma septosporum NZE10]|uniref:Uncharacterized protein n=1 Tax=Dothistroma septosporum (strain NZE10 / CBS 128990) TaxID=675120 RepID=N1PWP1_DOTSN|nr:hypothetical protein DOTSEDRAFT_31857 [Dothistroma septosporum NZE10]
MARILPPRPNISLESIPQPHVSGSRRSVLSRQPSVPYDRSTVSSKRQGPSGPPISPPASNPLGVLDDIFVAEQLLDTPQPTQTREQLLERYYQPKMLFNKSAKSTKSDSSSTTSKASTLSTARLIKNKVISSLRPTSERSSSTSEGLHSTCDNSPGKKRDHTWASRINSETLATLWALK